MPDVSPDLLLLSFVNLFGCPLCFTRENTLITRALITKVRTALNLTRDVNRVRRTLYFTLRRESAKTTDYTIS